MKKLLYIVFLGLLPMLLTQSCEEEAVYPELTWMQTTTLDATLQTDSLNFIVGLNAFTGNPQEMVSDEVKIHFDIDWNEGEGNPIKEVKLFIYAQETIGDNNALHGVYPEKELAVITEFTEDGKFELKLKATDLYEMFRYDFDGGRDRSVTPVLPGDIFEIKWMLTAEDGSVFDSRKDCFGPDCQLGFATVGQNLIPPYWVGTFDYLYIEAGTGSNKQVGDGGTVEITEITGGEYSIASAIFYGYKFDDYPGVIYYDFPTGEISVSAADDVVWQITNVAPKVLTIKWTYKWTAGYDEWGVVELTRTDDKDWPDNIHTL